MHTKDFFRIFIVAMLMCVLTCLGWMFFAQPESQEFSLWNELSDFFLNIFTGLLVLIIGIIVFDKLIKLYQAKRAFPIKAALHREVQIIMSRFINLLTEMYRESVPDNESFNPATITELFSESTFENLGRYFDISATAPVTSNVNWAVHLYENSIDFGSRIDKIFNRYLSIEPDLFKYLHDFENSLVEYFKIPYQMSLYDNSQNIPRPKCLCYYIPKLEKIDFETFKEICEWCNKTYIELRNIFNLCEIKIFPIDKRPLRAHISEKSLTIQIKTFNDWQNKKK